MIEFAITPFVGPLPLRFGMTPQEVAAILGAPDRVFHFDNRSESRPHLSLGYSAQDKLVEAVFAPGAIVRFDGQDLLLLSDPVDFLRRHDSRPFAGLGLIVFLNLGIHLSGYLPDDDDPSQKSISATHRTYYDEVMDELSPMSE